VSSALREVKIPADVYQAVQDRFGSQFETVDELVEFALRELLRDDSGGLDESEQQMIRNRLKDLGYL
jgi:hypothetical protein